MLFVIVLCVRPLVCRLFRVNIYTARLMCCCMFAPFCLRVSLGLPRCLFVFVRYCHFYVLHTAHQYTPHCTHTRVKAQLTHTLHIPDSTCLHAPIIRLTYFLVSLQSRKASDQTKSNESKTDSIGSGRAIPIKQVRHHIYSLFI